MITNRNRFFMLNTQVTHFQIFKSASATWRGKKKKIPQEPLGHHCDLLMSAQPQEQPGSWSQTLSWVFGIQTCWSTICLTEGRVNTGCPLAGYPSSPSQFESQAPIKQQWQQNSSKTRTSLCRLLHHSWLWHQVWLDHHETKLNLKSRNDFSNKADLM